MHTSDEGFELIKKFEGCELEAYQCAAGVWTIGYGHTKDVQEGDKWSEEKAEFMLWRELEDEYEHYINALVTVPINGERKVWPGLTRRREAEALMFEGRDWQHI
jgi:lysozyme